MTEEEQYIACFFEEKKIPVTIWDVPDFNGRRHLIDSGVVISRIKRLPQVRKRCVITELRHLDRCNYSVLPFLENLAKYFVLTPEFTLREIEK